MRSCSRRCHTTNLLTPGTLSAFIRMMITGRTSFFFATVPVQGMKDGVLHLITSELASELPPGRVERFRLVLATKPYNHFFLAHIPSTNLDNIWNETCVRACTEARAKWRMVVSRKIEGKEGYDSEPTRNEKQGLPPPFPEPAWLKEKFLNGSLRCRLKVR